SQRSPTGQLDLPRTLLGLLGVSDRGLVTLGRDVLREDGLVAFRDGGFARDNHVCLVTGARGERHRCFDVTTGRPVSAELFAADFAEARARLDASDKIIYGDLVPELRQR